MKYVAPEEILLGYNQSGKPDTMQYIPILESLKLLLEHEDVLSELLSHKQSQDGIIRDYCDGYVYRRNPLFIRYPTALQIKYYYDDFTLNNQFRDRGRKYKISGHYFVLGNLDAKYRSKLDMMQLVMLCRSSHVKKYGAEQILQPLIRDIHILETEGITVQLDGNEYHFYGTISFVASDNLGAHFMAGMFENFSTVLRQCRFCNSTKHNMHNNYDEGTFQSRANKEIWNTQAEAGTDNMDFARVYGIKRHSPLNQLSYYHVSQGLPSDASHDLFEGVIPIILQTLFGRFVDQGHFTYAELSIGVARFKYVEVDKKNAIPILGSTAGTMKIKFTQAQTWCFLRLLPLMIGSLIPFGNGDWDFLLSDIFDLSHNYCSYFVLNF
ncbi:uncharacterized protein LOC117111388 [Anneissia japonica]|uniref:uncharacterized protein LOC117111388 n=1 Tax=Anneissia japonica TaxID=1529436 RepID=UPI001425918E|nr:uncharacterized protein LOC117111388 [Anneissia japonica]